MLRNNTVLYISSFQGDAYSDRGPTRHEIVSEKPPTATKITSATCDQTACDSLARTEMRTNGLTI